ncbi:MAG: oligopeptide transporter, OPT family [Planctomycetes bacterium]|nr:oligopeptide transporter, OPT family [Planctomycetota bacterium]MBI3833665.1 oligopeptide transporter, OPT family [Planctomycetota bacterium]
MKDDAQAGVTADVTEHKPYIPAEANIPEFGLAPIIVGAILGIIFGASSLYLVLKVGMTVSASIPIAVLSITLFRVFPKIPLIRRLVHRNATVLENNIVQTTGSAGESIAFGIGVTMPAIMILGYDLELTRVMIVGILGGLIGILMMIPLRRAFIVKQHGKLTYPEGTACADVLIVGEKGGTSAATVFIGFGIAFVYKVLSGSLRLWKETVASTLSFFKGAQLSCDMDPALIGVGYIIGTRISCIMVAGGVLAYLVLIPTIVLFGEGLGSPLFPAEKLLRNMTVGEIQKTYVLYIGAGAVAAAGILSMIRAMPLIVTSLKTGLRDLAVRRADTTGAHSAVGLRTDHDLSMKTVILGIVFLIVAITLAPMLHMNVLGAILIVLFGFLFVTVSSRLTGEIGSSSNPISGMTVATLLMTCLIFLAMGWTGPMDRVTALSIAAIVCIAASNGGTTSQDLKTGFLLGATPRFQQIAILVGALTSALVIGVVLMMLNSAYTVYSKKDLPTIKIETATLSQKEKVGGTDYANDTNEYYVFHATPGQIKGVPAGRYLVDDAGSIKYLVDPGVQGQLTTTDDGHEVTKLNPPQAALFALIIDGILTHKLPWALVLLGVSITIVLELSGISSLAFAVGVYLPLSTTAPIFIGGAIRWLVEKWRGSSAGDGEMSPGVLLSSGYIAGGTIAGVLGALVSIKWKSLGDWGPKALGELASENWFALATFAALCIWLVIVGKKRDGEVVH